MGGRDFILMILITFLSVLTTILLVFEAEMTKTLFIAQILVIFILLIIALLGITSLYYMLDWSYGLFFLFFTLSLLNIIALYVLASSLKGTIIFIIVNIIGFGMSIYYLCKEKPIELPPIEMEFTPVKKDMILETYDANSNINADMMSEKRYPIYPPIVREVKNPILKEIRKDIKTKESRYKAQPQVLSSRKEISKKITPNKKKKKNKSTKAVFTKKQKKIVVNKSSKKKQHKKNPKRR